jgi:hypothetical protein
MPTVKKFFDHKNNDGFFCEELNLIKARREELGLDVNSPRFGLALSGGGIRSAVFNIGLTKVLKERGILKRLDYISSVSGGGYVNAYIQKSMESVEEYDNSDNDSIFGKNSINYFKKYKNYLNPNQGILKLDNIIFLTSYILFAVVHILWYILFLTLIVYISSLVTYSSEYIFSYFNYINSILSLPKIDNNNKIIFFILSLFLFIVWSYLANPNRLSMFIYYRFRLKKLFLDSDDIHLSKLIKTTTDGVNYTIAPYPLFNTTLNIQNDKKIKGVKSCDYFLFSPLYCGSKLTGYISTDSKEYKGIDLSTVMTISGAALNPHMGYFSTKFISFIMIILNIRLGYWIDNPKTINNKKLYRDMVPWAFYNISELIGHMSLEKNKVNLSDGGHIENLGAFELLRRRCELIIISDVGADNEYSFYDLKVLMKRTRTELHLSIEFEDGKDPERLIRPHTTNGFSQQPYAIAKIYDLSDSSIRREPIGTLIYIKASVTASSRVYQKHSHKYQNYHPTFPHESTLDQFFDDDQWDAYENLGEEIANYVLDMKNISHLLDSLDSMEKELCN